MRSALRANRVIVGVRWAIRYLNAKMGLAAPATAAVSAKSRVGKSSRAGKARAGFAAALLYAAVALFFGSDGSNAVAADSAEPSAQKSQRHDLESNGLDSVPEPADYRLNDYRSPVPKTLKGARVITADDARDLMKAGEAIFIDVYPKAPKPPNLPKNTVWRDPQHMSIKGAHWLPNVGYGILAPKVQDYFTRHLALLSGNDKAKPVVFFCLKDCWMSWNAAKRALEYGYTSVIWFPEGTDGWQEAGKNLTLVNAVED